MTENGVSAKGEDGMSDGQAVRDEQRVDFYKNYVGAATDAVLVDKVSQHDRALCLCWTPDSPLLFEGQPVLWRLLRLC